MLRNSNKVLDYTDNETGGPVASGIFDNEEELMNTDNNDRNQENDTQWHQAQDSPLPKNPNAPFPPGTVPLKQPPQKPKPDRKEEK